jgi:Glycosyltransferase family 87
MNKTPRLLLTLIALGAAALLIVLQFQRLLNDRSILQIDDFVEYWAAGQLNAQGKNPYDPDKLLPLERAAGRDTDEAVMMWNPPWTLTLAMPFGLMDSRAAQLLWLALGFGLVVLGADVLWRLYGGPPESRWISWALAFTFLPTFFVLHAGQIGTWVFAGTVLFLYFQKRGWSMLAGASTVLLAIKPHLVYLFWIALVVWGIRRDRRMLLGSLIAGVLTTAIPLACNHGVLEQYWYELRHRPPAQWESPTLGTLIRLIEGEASDGKSRFGLTFLPAVLGVGWLLWHAWKLRGRTGTQSAPLRKAFVSRDAESSERSAFHPDAESSERSAFHPDAESSERSAFHSQRWIWSEQMPMLLLVSFVTAAYGAWPFDLVILLPAAIHTAVAIVAFKDPVQLRLGLACWITINLAALTLNILKINSFWFIWMAPAMLAAYVALPGYRKTEPA